MAHNNFGYGIIEKNDFAEAESRGYDCSIPSTDGKHAIVDKEIVGDTFPWANTVIANLPQYMLDAGVTDKNIDHELAEEIAITVASVKGASDGYQPPEDY